MNTQKQIFLIVVLLFTFVGGCGAYSLIDLPYRAPMQQNFLQSESINRGALLFANNCRNCHGIQGQGGVGLPLNTALFHNQDPLTLAANRDLILRTLQCGRAGTLMPAWLATNGGSLSAEQLNHLVDFLTAPVDPNLKDAQGNPTNVGWQEALQYAHNLNAAVTGLIGGDTLDTIASAHGIGYQQLADYNHLPLTSTYLPVGAVVHMPGFKGMPNGYDYIVYNTNETISKIADSQHVGAMILADLNNIPYQFTEAKDIAKYTLLDPQGQVIPGLYPGDTLKLPAGSTYIVTAGDTLTSIAQQHGITPSDLVSLNEARLKGLAPDAPVPFENTLKLPPNTKILVQKGQTLSAIAAEHGISAADLEKTNNLQPGQQPTPGQELALPSATTEYVIQTGDTLAKVAALHTTNGQPTTVEELASANGLKPTDEITPNVILKLPTVNAYVVKGQSLADLAKTYSNVTADSLASANSIPSNAIVRIGTPLKLPADAWGPAPATTINPGTGCTQYTVPASVFQTLPGLSTPTAEATTTAPTTVSKNVEIDAGTTGTDWTVVADGVASKPNEGNVTIAAGTVVKFLDKVGVHTINLNGQQQGAIFQPGDTRQITFSTPGAFTITCSFHPQMLAHVNVK